MPNMHHFFQQFKSSIHFRSQISRHGQIWLHALKGFGANHGLQAAGNMAFLAMLSLFPFLIFLISLSGFFGQTDKGKDAIVFMMSVLPTEISSVMTGPINGIINNAGREILTTAIFIALWTAANGIEAARDSILKAFHSLTDDKNQPGFWIRRLESMAIVIVSGFIILLAMSILVLGPVLFKLGTSYLPSELMTLLEPLWRLINLALSPSLLLLGIYALYLALTPRSLGYTYRLPGAIIALFIFMATAKGLSYYLSFVGGYDVTYGSLAGVVITQLFCFVISIGFILGAEINAAYSYAKDANKLC